MRWCLVLTLITIGLALGLPPDPAAVQQLHTSASAYRLAVAALLIPYIVIWYVSFYAFAKLREYSKPLKDSKDGLAFHKITVGMGIIAFSLIIPTAISLILNSVAAHNPSFKAASIIINNYLGLFPGLLGFLFLYNGARMLLRTTRQGMHRFDIRWHAPWFLLLSVMFTHLAIENYYRWHPYHLGLFLLIITFIVPYLFGWLVGLLCAYELNWYAKTVKGLLYRQGIRRFANGIAITILASIAIQFVNITLAERLEKSLGNLLLAEYGLLIIVAVGLILMALGTKKLKRIEES
jgi:hypothetical protein